MTVSDQIAKCGGRRFFLTCGASAIYTIMFALSVLTESGYITLQVMTVGAYLAANGHQKHMEIKNGNPD